MPTFTVTGVATGKIQVVDGVFNLINATGFGEGQATGTLQYDGSEYSVSGSQDVYYGIAGGQYAVLNLSFAAVRVPLHTDDLSLALTYDDPYGASGSSLSDLEGYGAAGDGMEPGDLEYDASSVAQLIPGKGSTDTQSQTSTTVASSMDPSTVGQPVTFTADVAPDSGATATGTVQFQVDGANVGGAVSLRDGVATSKPVDTLSVGDHSVVAVYGGNAEFGGSTSDAITQTVTPITLESITGSIGSQSQTSVDDSLSITDDNVFSVPQSSGTISLIGNNLSTTDPSILKHVKWTVERNANDAVSGNNPKITQTGPLEAAIGEDGVGSFNAIVYYDANRDGKYESGEELKVFHLAEVSITVVQSAEISTASSSFFSASPEVISSSPDGQQTTLASGDFTSQYANFTQETIIVRGGGADGSIGISQIHVGWLQNGSGDSFKAKYANGRTLAEKIHDPQTLAPLAFPILDGTQPASGGSTVFGNQPEQILGADPAGGQDRKVTDYDSPEVIFDTTFPSAASVVSSTSGSNDFRDYLVAYSDDYNQWYGAYRQIDWSASFNFKNVDSTWSNEDSRVAAKVVRIAKPTSLGSLHAKSSGPLFADSVYFAAD